MFKSFDRYILKEVASPFGIGLAIYTFTLLINQILILSHTLISKAATGGTILKILIYLLPDFLAFTIPMSTLMGVLAGLSRMSSDSEIVAFRTMGINNARILRPILVFALFTWFVSTWLIMYLAPEANFQFNQLYNQIGVSRAVSNIKPGTFYREFPFYTLYFNDIDSRSNEWKDVFLYSQKKGDTDTVIIADSGRYVPNPGGEEGYIILKDPVAHGYKKKEPEESYTITHYKLLKESVPSPIKTKQTRRSNQLIFPELVKKRKQKPDNLSMNIEFHRKFSLPFACIAFGFLALPLGISTKKGGKVSGFIISLGIIFVYYTLMTLSESLVLRKTLPPFWGMWLPNIFLIVTGVILYYYTAREKSINWKKFFNIMTKIKNGVGKISFLKNRHPIVVFKIRRVRLRFLKILDVYVTRKLTLTFFFVFTSMILIFYVIGIFELIDDVVDNKVAFHYVLKHVFYSTPGLLAFILPVSALTSVLLTFSWMSKNNEIAAVQISGISLHRLSLPAIFLGIIVSLAAFGLQEEVAPEANRRAREVLSIIHKRKTKTEAEFEKNWIVGKNNTFYFYNFFDRNRNRFNRFNIVMMDENFNVRRRISATEAFWRNQTMITLKSGFEKDFEGNTPLPTQTFQQKNMIIPEGRDFFKKKVFFSEFMNIRELKNYIRYLKENNSNSQKYEAELYQKHAFPFASLVMVLIAIPFSFIMGNRGTLYGIGIAVGISMIFWGAIGIFNSLGSTAILSPFISAFAPSFLFMAASIYLFLHVKT
jgi:LPS export ABC transporter permease LptF/LPS export ABC transporter permease LptG